MCDKEKEKYWGKVNGKIPTNIPTHFNVIHCVQFALILCYYLSDTFPHVSVFRKLT